MTSVNTLDLTNLSSEPVESNVKVEITDAPADSEAEVEEVAEVVVEPVVATPEPVPEEETVITEPETSTAPVEQVAADIRNILTEVPTTSEETVESVETTELSDDLKQRIAELDYLRECCGKWVEGAKGGRKIFLNLWKNKSISVNSRINYEDVLDQLEKLPELILMWDERIPHFRKNKYFENIETYNLEKSLFNENQNTIQKIEVLEQLITLITDCANMKYEKENVRLRKNINNLY